LRPPCWPERPKIFKSAPRSCALLRGTGVRRSSADALGICSLQGGSNRMPEILSSAPERPYDAARGLHLCRLFQATVLSFRLCFCNSSWEPVRPWPSPRLPSWLQEVSRSLGPLHCIFFSGPFLNFLKNTSRARGQRSVLLLFTSFYSLMSTDLHFDSVRLFLSPPTRG